MKNLLTDIELEEIRAKFRTGNYEKKQLAREYNVSQAAIAHVIKQRYFRRTKKNGT